MGKCVVVAELSGNHSGNYGQALRLVDVAKECGADMVKFQCYQPDLMPDKDEIVTGCGSNWDGQKWLDVYRRIYTPRGWIRDLADYAKTIGITPFTTVCDLGTLTWLEENVNLSAYKVPSWLCLDSWFMIRVVRTDKRVIVTAPSPDHESWLTSHGCEVLTKDARRVNGQIGYSSHDDPLFCVVAVVKGAPMVEQHLTLSLDSIDGQFAALPHEFKEMVRQIRKVEEVL
jgi:sialic acid synthase SpsE